MNRTSAVAGLLTLFIAVGAQAVSLKTDSSYDYRIKSVVYNPIDVVEIDGVQGLSTNIQLAPDEEYVTHTFGGENLWLLTHKENHVFVRPINELADTNLTLITNKRTYYLVLRYIDKAPVKQKDGTVVNDFIETPWKLRQATLGLIYQYPFEDMQAANKTLEQRRIREALDSQAVNGPTNIQYQMSDDASYRPIQPVHVWDNYRFTSFEFPVNTDLPTLYVIGGDGKEQVVNAEAVGPNHNILQAQMTAKEWRIRLGDRVVGVVNGSYNPALGANPNGTVAPEVNRVLLKKEAQ